MALKRPFNDQLLNQVSSKHPRRDGSSTQIISCNNISLQFITPEPYQSAEASTENNKMVFQGHDSSSCPDTIQESVHDIETDGPRSAFMLHWATSCASDEDEPSEELTRLPFFPGYFSFDRAVGSSTSPNDVYYSLLDYPPRKRVPVGPEHQAEIPGCSTHGSVIASDTTIEIGDSEHLGICRLSGPETEPPSYDGKKVGDGRSDCICQDHGSVRCVRQHIVEAREKLRKALGQDTYMELGFSDMGEVVAEKWSEEEEQLFDEVVYSNPASLGKNFWNGLSAVFPCRTKMEIVSYYFNVFMLRKRAEQNRCDPLNIDSDNDEWQGSDDDGAVSEEDEHSGVESPVIQNGNHDVFDSTFEHPRKKADGDVQDGSCTSSDSGAPVQGRQLKPEGCLEWYDYIVESCDGKGWDGNNMSCCLKSSEDLLPTCSMIEEVFGHTD